MTVEEGGQLGFREGADLGRRELAVLEQHQRRNAADAELGRHVAIFVDVHLGDLQATVVVLRDLVEDRRNHLARAAPLGPVVDQHRLAGLQHVGVERGVGGVFDQFTAHGSSFCLHRSSWVARHNDSDTKASLPRGVGPFTTLFVPMTTIVRAPLENAAGDATRWPAIAARVAAWADEQGLALRDAVVLVPFAQLLPEARRAFARAGGWMPRVETTRTLA